MLIIISAFTIPTGIAYADEWRDYRSSTTIPEERISQRVIDEADILTNEEERKLNKKLDDINANYDYDVVVVTAEDLERYTATEFADDCYDYNGFSENGILFLVSIEDRDWAISTAGEAVNAFSDYDQKVIFDSMKGYLGEDEWYKAFDKFAGQCNKYIDKYQNRDKTSTNFNYDSETTVFQYNNYNSVTSNNYSNDIEPISEKRTTLQIAVSIIVFAVIAGLIAAVLKKRANNKKMLGNEVGFSAETYIDGGVNIIDQYDRFIRNEHSEHFVKTADSSNNSSHHTSTVHHSSSGRTHGGSSGKF